MADPDQLPQSKQVADANLPETSTVFSRHPVLWGFLAVLTGALLGGIAQVVVEVIKDRHDNERYRAERAGEIMTLVAEAQWLYVDAERMAFQDPTHMPPPPPEPDRVYALVALNFPRLTASARAFEAACWNQYEAVQEMGIQQRRGVVVDPNPEAETWRKLFDAREKLLHEVSREIGVATDERQHADGAPASAAP
jgi:hypothetical protein